MKRNANQQAIKLQEEMSRKTESRGIDLRCDRQLAGQDCTPNCQKAKREACENVMTLLPAKVDPRLLMDYPVLFGSTKFEDHLSLLIHRVRHSDSLAKYLAQVLCDDYVNGLLLDPIGKRRWALVQQLRVGGIEACLLASMDPWRKDILYVATVQLGLILHISGKNRESPCCAGERLRAIAEPALRELQRTDAYIAARLVEAVGWGDATDPECEIGQRGDVMGGLRSAGLLKVRSWSHVKH